MQKECTISLQYKGMQLYAKILGMSYGANAVMALTIVLIKST